MIREAIANYQVGQVPDQELLQFLIGKEAEKLTIPLNEAMRLEHAELVRTLGKRSATKLSAAFELARRAMTPRQRDLQFGTPVDVFRFMRPKIAHLPRETFWSLLLDTRHKLIRTVQVAEGGLASCALSARDVFAPAIREDAPVLVFVHNHPSGDPTPSRDDILMTERFGKAAQLLGIQLIDHVVIADGGFSSLAEMGKL